MFPLSNNRTLWTGDNYQNSSHIESRRGGGGFGKLKASRNCILLGENEGRVLGSFRAACMAHRVPGGLKLV